MGLSEQHGRSERGMAWRWRRLGESMIIRREPLVAAFAKPFQEVAHGSRAEIEFLADFGGGRAMALREGVWPVGLAAVRATA
jgi:hypothetical protein